MFLLAGQSNMAGRGVVSDEDKTSHPRVFALSKDGEWVPAVDPIHYDKSIAGVGPAMSFAIALAERDKDIAIGLIPAACGGSPISSWEPSVYYDPTKSHPYDDAIARVKRAMQDGTLKGILWHQGESDSKPELASQYKSKLKILIERFRTGLHADRLPFLIGQLGQFSENPWDDAKRTVDEAHVSLANEMEMVGFVSSDGLACKDDHIHFNTQSQREFGRRYAEVFLELTK